MTSTINVDTIGENTSGSGVTIDSVLIKDGVVNGIFEMVDMWQLTANITTDGTNNITSNLSRYTSGTLVTTIGTGMTESSGQFSFPSTGKYLIQVQGYLASRSNGAGDARLYTQATDDNFSTSSRINWNRVYANAYNQYTTTFSQTLVDITDTSNDKIIFQSYTSGDGEILGTYTIFGFYKLGET